MSWIDDRIWERNVKNERDRVISEGAEDLYESLWKKIVEDVNEAREKKAGDLFTNGTHHKKAVTMTATPRGQEQSKKQDKFVLAFDPKKKEITAEGDRVKTTFTFSRCEDGTVCLA